MTIKLPAPSKVLQIIDRWRKIDLRKITDTDIDQEMEKFIDSLEYFFVPSSTQTPNKLWRIRISNETITNESQLWEPPPKNTKMGRCNSEGNPVLYVSLKLNTPFEELNINIDESVYLIKYECNDSLKLVRAFPEQFHVKDLNGNEIYDKESLLSYQILREFLRTEFLKPVGKGTEYLHRISGSLCRTWLNVEDADGWIYPSVQAPDEYNIALTRKSAHKKLSIKDVHIVKIVSKNEAITSLKNNPNAPIIINSMKIVIKSIYKSHFTSEGIDWIPENNCFGGDY